MKYDLFLFDADDTLFDFKSCEKQAFTATLRQHGHSTDVEDLYKTYGVESLALWHDVEQGKISKSFLKGERFRRTFEKHNVDLPANQVGETYLDLLPQTCVLIDHAFELCQALSQKGQIGIITNGFETVQTRRLKGSSLAPFVSFMVVSEQCGYTKPDVRFFEYTAGLVDGFRKENTLVIGDRLEADIQGAHNFGVDSCWFNPHKKPSTTPRPSYEINHLSQLLSVVSETDGSTASP